MEFGAVDIRDATRCGNAARNTLPERVRNGEFPFDAEIGSFFGFLMALEDAAVDGATDSALAAGLAGADANAAAARFRGRMILRFVGRI